MGASHLQTLEYDLPEQSREFVTVQYKRCLDLCTDNDPGKAPFVLIDNEVITDATVHKIIDKVALLIEKRQSEDGDI